MEPHELPTEAAIREVYEETKISVKVQGLVAVRNLVTENVNNTSLIYYMTPITETEPVPDGQEIDQVGFFSLAEIMQSDQIAAWLRLFAAKTLTRPIQFFQHQENPEKSNIKFEVYY